MIRVLLLAHYGSLAAPSRYRFYQYFSHPACAGFEVTTSVLQTNGMLRWIFAGQRWKAYALMPFTYLARCRQLLASSRYDLVIVEKECLPYLPTWFETMVGFGRVPYLVDYDDAVFHKYDTGRSPLIRLLYGRKLATVMERAAAVTCGNDYIARYARQANARHIALFPTVIDLQKYERTSTGTRSGCAVIGWIGTTTNSRHLALLAEPLAALAERHDFILRIVGGWKVELPPNIRVEYVPWVEAEEVDRIASFDIGIMPLPDAPWERGKCGLKLLQCMAAGVPVVASPVGVNTTIVSHGANGFLAATNEEWRDALASLLQSQELRETLGAAGRETVRTHYSLDAWAPRFRDLLHTVAGREALPQPGAA